MSKNKNKPWNENWEFIDKIGGGGQGQTSLVKPRNDSYLPSQYVLKILNRPKDKERRARMYREIAALETLENSGIPKIIDSNSQQFKDLDTPLYLVSEFIQGKTLDNFIKENTMNLVDSVTFFIKLLDILEYCHNRDIIHRDIKPDNIIITNNNDPVLIDFGLSFNKEDDKISLTSTGQQLGNRFLYLPELSEKSSLQRDSRSDITQCCGILFFVITGKHPTTLLDAEEQKPHQRASLNDNLLVLPEHQLSQINRIFDRAFTIKIDYRWQSIPEIKMLLNDLLQPNSNKSADYLTRIQNKLSGSSEYQQRKLLENLAKQIIEVIWDVGNQVISELGSDFYCIKTCSATQNVTWRASSKRNTLSATINWENLTFSERFGISLNCSNKNFNPEFRGYITGNELVLVSDLKGKEVELLRTPLSSEPDFTGFSERLTNFYHEGVDDII